MAARELAITYRRLEELLPYAANARTHSDAQVAEVVASMKAFGWTNPILLDEESGILAGHARLQAAIKLKLKKVPCLVLTGLTSDQRRAYILADNKIATNAGWDLALLASELKALEVSGFQMGLTGFSGTELSELLGQDAPVRTGKTADDEVPELGPHISRRRDVWLCGRHRVMCGDCTDLDEIQTLVPPPELVDVVWTDPPYNVDYQGNAGTIANDNLSVAKFGSLLAGAFQNCYRVMRGGAVIYVAHADTERAAFTNAFEKEFKLAQVIIWVKNNAAFSRQDFNWKHEPILYGWKEGAAHYFSGDYTRTTVMDDEQDLTRMKREELLFYAQQLRSLIPTDVVRVDKPVKSDLHPTMKPVALIQQMLRNSSLEGQSVLDVFGGSGSTLIAAEKQGLQARIMELEPRYADVIVRRWQDFTGKRATLSGSGRCFAEVARERTPAQKITDTTEAHA